MLTSYVVGVAVLVALVLAWAGVQGLWRNSFPEAAPGGDALAGRLGCHGCGSCTNDCESQPTEKSGPAREEKS